MVFVHIVAIFVFMIGVTFFVTQTQDLEFGTVGIGDIIDSKYPYIFSSQTIALIRLCFGSTIWTLMIYLLLDPVGFTAR